MENAYPSPTILTWLLIIILLISAETWSPTWLPSWEGQVSDDINSLSHSPKGSSVLPAPQMLAGREEFEDS